MTLNSTLAKRIIPCLDVKDGQVVKGIQFKHHVVLGDILNLAEKYSADGADELVFYDITASADQRHVDKSWVNDVAKKINIPFCVAGGIRSLSHAYDVLNYGADKISINSPALESPELITQLSNQFGSQCIVIGIDSMKVNSDLHVYKYTGREELMQSSHRHTLEWAKEVEDRGAGEIVLNCMNQDGTKEGYDIEQLKQLKDTVRIPIIASGGAGNTQHFIDAFTQANVDGALAAGIFHRNELSISTLKKELLHHGITIRL